MIRSDTYRFIFVHVRKTGGSAITAALGPFLGYEVPRKDELGWQGRCHNHGEMHSPFRWEQEYADHFSFGFVRNPFEVLVSLYHNWAAGGRREVGRRTQQLGSFSAFVRAFFTEGTYSSWAAQNQEYLCTCPKTGRVVDFIGRFDHLQRDWDRVCRHVGLPRVVLPRRNVMPHPPYQRMYDAESRRLVERLWGSELAFTRYGWDGPVGGSSAIPGRRAAPAPATA